MLKPLNKDAVEGTHTLFCGAWASYGFHEDGLTSGLNAANLLGAKCPFPIMDVHDHVDELERQRYESGIALALLGDFMNLLIFFVMLGVDLVMKMTFRGSPKLTKKRI